MSQESLSIPLNRLRRLPEELAAGSPMTDEAILAIVAAAQGIFAAVAPLCQHRPLLVRPLLRRALLPLVYLGYERDQQVQKFVGWLLAQQSTYLPISADGRVWLADEFPRNRETVQQLLDELLR
jgi:hypothetical protein